MIKKYYVKAKKPGYAFDRNAKKFFSWGFDIWIGGERKQERGFLTKTDAETAVTKLKQQAKLSAHGVVSTAKIPYLIELFQKRLDSMEQSKDRVRAKRVYKYFLELLPPKIKVTDLRTAHIQLYVEARQKNSDKRTGKLITNQTIRRELVPIVSALTSAYLYFESLDEYRAPRIPRPKIPKDKKERVISKAEQDGLFKYFFAAQGEKEDPREFANRRRTGQFLLFCLLTLSRPGEIAALKKSDVDLSLGIVAITGTKTRFTSEQTVRRLTITATMRKIIEERLSVAPADYLFTRSGAVTPAMYEQMEVACKKIGVKYGRTDRQAISFHTARHTGITMLLQNGVDLKTVGGMAGQSDERMTLYYTHTNRELVHRASEILERKMGKQNSIYFMDR